MSRKTDPWWVCNVCDKPVKRVGKPKDDELAAQGGHRKVCPKATYSIRQIEQRKRQPG